MRTAGQFQQDTPFSDGVLFFGDGAFAKVTNFGSNSSNTTPIVNQLILTQSASGSLQFTVNTSLMRTGTAPNYQEQFGTAALQPGPSLVAGTSDPLGLVGMPPTKQASLATLKGGSSGFVPKGFQINYIDVVYAITALALTSIAIGITKNSIATGTSVAKNLLVSGTNGLTTAVTAGKVTRVIPSIIEFNTGVNDQVLVGFQAVTPATSNFYLYGFWVGISYNFN